MKILPNIKARAEIGLLGGSFDPPHLGHQLLALSFLALEPIDELWLIPCADHALKGELSSFDHRLAMCRLAFARMHGVQVLDVERHLPSPSYTIKTINFIKEEEPNIHLHLALGSDLVASFDKWHKPEELAQEVDIVIFDRMGHRIEALPPILSHARLHNGYALPELNSTKLRQQLKSGSHDRRYEYLDRKVAAYIDEHGLYR